MLRWWMIPTLVLRLVVAYVFRCHHRNTSFPMSPRGRNVTYVVCLDCGRQLDYDWKRMELK